MPRMSFLGDDTNAILQTGNSVAGNKLTMSTFTNKAMVPETGIRGVRVRAT